MKVSGVRISAIVHATEDVGKVVAAIAELSAQQILASRIKKMRLKGHYGNEITTLNAVLKGAFAEVFFLQLWSKMLKSDKRLLIESLETRLDNAGRLYLRVEKQAAFLGSYRLTEQDPIKLEVSFRDSQGSICQPAVLRQMLRSEGIETANSTGTSDV